MGAISLATVLAVVDELLVILSNPKVLAALVEAGVNLAHVVNKIEAVWAEADVKADDPAFAKTAKGIADARAKLRARLAEINAG